MKGSGLKMGVSKTRKFKITRKTYDTICTFLIPIILTVLVELFKNLYSYAIYSESSSGNILGKEFPQLKGFLILASIIVYLFLFWIILRINEWIKGVLFKDPDEEKYMKDTFLRLKDFGSKRQECFKTDFNYPTYIEFLMETHKRSIDLVVSSCWEFFKDSFSGSENLVDEISFEVSFMSKSYKDNKITIVSSENNKHRIPRSMQLRKSESDIYGGTETGKLYNRYNNKPSKILTIHIIEDCSTEDEFTALYEGEIEDIKSMAVLPVLSPQNELLGTLVVCANQTNFFKKKERLFWNELLEIYSVELGYHYLALKYCIEHNDDIEESLKKPF